MEFDKIENNQENVHEQQKNEIPPISSAIPEQISEQQTINNLQNNQQQYNQTQYNQPQNFQQQYNQNMSQQYNPNMQQNYYQNGQQYNQPNQYPYYGMPFQQQMPEQKGSGLSIASMVLGIVSICLSCMFYISIPCAVIGLILGIVAKKTGRKGSSMAIAGIVTSSIGLLLSIVWLIYIIAVGTSGSSSTSPFSYNFDYNTYKS